MSRVVGIMGESGSGKTTAMRTLPPEKTMYIDCDGKGLCWRGWRERYNGQKKNYVRTDSFATVQKVLTHVDKDPAYSHIRYVVIDTLNALMVADEMQILSMQGGDKRSAWSDLAQSGWALINAVLRLRDNLTVIILCHSETISDDNGIIRTRIKTNGRKLEKLVLESKMTTVVWAVRQDGKNKFILSADGSTAKVPLGAFNTDECENNIMIVLNALKDF